MKLVHLFRKAVFRSRIDGFKEMLKELVYVNMDRNEAYLFDLFVFPEHRGGDITRKIAAWTFQHLLSIGVTRIYGFYFSDNLRSLWWHRAILKCKELKRLKTHRLFMLQWTDRKTAVNF